jgi:hypothetical protein
MLMQRAAPRQLANEWSNCASSFSARWRLGKMRACVARAVARRIPDGAAGLEELDAFYAWWQERMPVLWEEWNLNKTSKLGGRRD